MSAVADQLRQAREAKNLTVHQVAEITKMRTDHLRALEEGNYNVFSAPVYIRGFVRTYSTLLKLDVEQMMHALDVELGATQKFAEPPPLTDQPRGVVDFLMLHLSQVDWRKGLIGLGLAVVLVVTLLSLSAWRNSRSTDPSKGVKPAVYQAGSDSAGDTLPLPSPKR
jgi:cytoskeleton protein RodZ